MITVTLPAPISANRYWRTRVAKGIVMTYISPEAKTFKADVAYILRDAGVRKPIEGRVAVNITLYPHRPLDWQKRQQKLGDAWDDSVRSIDLDNAIKVTLDSLKGLAFEDDVWVRSIWSMRAEPDALGARMVVVVYPIAKPVVQAALDLSAVPVRVVDPLEI